MYTSAGAGMTTYAIPDDTSFDGEWWRPSDGEHQIPGTLAWSKNKATLALHDSFTPLRSGPIYQSAPSQPTIHGTTTNGDLVSVLGALWARGSLSFGQAGVSRPESFVSNLIVIGAHVTAETRYPRLRARIPGLPAWLGDGAVHQTLTTRTGEHPNSILDYRISPGSGKQVELPSINAALRWITGASTSGSALTTVTIAAHGYLEIAPREPQVLDWYFEQLGKVTTLLAFLAGAPIHADQISPKIADAQPEVNVLVGWSNPGYCPYGNPNEFFMPRHAMGVELSVVLQRWFELHDRVTMPCRLALSVLSSDGLWVHVQFLLLMQALEGFHRATEQKRHRKMHLNDRVRELADRMHIDVQRRIFGMSQKVPPEWIDTRNYYTHWDEASRDDALDTQGMYYATVRLRHFLRALYLDFVGIPQTAIAKALDGANSESQHLIQLNHPAATFGHVEVRPANTTGPKAEEPHAGA
jgi:hypothetical protein